MVESVDLGLCDYWAARRVQESAVFALSQGHGPEVIYCCEHPDTLSLGKRTPEAEKRNAEDINEEIGCSLVTSDRGGEVTYHGPGQLVIYPVINLKVRGWGVRTFVRIVLSAIESTVRNFGVPCEARLDVPGVWCLRDSSMSVSSERSTVPGKKIAAIGLRIASGITSHGMSLNVNNRLDVYSRFSPCGFPGDSVTSIAQELGQGKISLAVVKKELCSSLIDCLSIEGGSPCSGLQCESRIDHSTHSVQESMR